MKEEELQQKMQQAIQWIRKKVEETGAKGVVIGDSGGKDSATVLGLAKNALGSDKVLAVIMPCHSNYQDRKDAIKVAESLKIKTMEIDLSKTYDSLERELNRGEKLTEESKINIKPRLRMTTLYAIAQTLNYLVMGTGNLCEIMVGYTTKWGDSSSDLNPIANFTVEEVVKIGEMLGIPSEVIHKAPNDGLGEKTDEEKLGVTYKQITEYINSGKIDPDAMKKIEEKYRKSEHKREPIPTFYFERKNYLKGINL